MVTVLAETRCGGRGIANRQIVRSSLFLSAKEEVLREKPDFLRFEGDRPTPNNWPIRVRLISPTHNRPLPSLVALRFAPAAPLQLVSTVSRPNSRRSSSL